MRPSIWTGLCTNIIFSVKHCASGTYNLAMLHNHILIIEDHELYRQGLRLALASALPAAQVSEAASVEQALAMSVAPVVVVLDIMLTGMRGLDGLDGIAEIRKTWPAAKVIMLSASNAAANIEIALARGAVAFLCKTESTQLILRAIEQVWQEHGKQVVVV